MTVSNRPMKCSLEIFINPLPVPATPEPGAGKSPPERLPGYGSQHTNGGQCNAPDCAGASSARVKTIYGTPEIPLLLVRLCSPALRRCRSTAVTVVTASC